MENQERPKRWSALEGEPAGDFELTDEELEGVTGGLERVYVPGQEADEDSGPSVPRFQTSGPR